MLMSGLINRNYYFRFEDNFSQRSKFSFVDLNQFYNTKFIYLLFRYVLVKCQYNFDMKLFINKHKFVLKDETSRLNLGGTKFNILGLSRLVIRFDHRQCFHRFGIWQARLRRRSTRRSPMKLIRLCSSIDIIENFDKQYNIQIIKTEMVYKIFNAFWPYVTLYIAHFSASVYTKGME
ncbi:hypothetical protein BpHYR1_012600 [Brachionus plicatilis]|uniref:Uncharacterized protein n=1 Tax=Brachionus plicatilis TaxID=10195 RepID=A0A3M7PER5_BRAPC|nr:hypothetical protein BpHYR1_012600 [Brachionus plicatilis]